MNKKQFVTLIIIFLALSVVVYAEKAFVVRLNANDKSVSFSGLNVLNRDLPEKINKSDYTAEIIDFSNKVIYKTNIFFPSFGSFNIIVPYKKEAKQILVKMSGKEIILIDTIEYSDFCGNGICNLAETKTSCPKDCSANATDSTKENAYETKTNAPDNLKDNSSSKNAATKPAKSTEDQNDNQNTKQNSSNILLTKQDLNSNNNGLNKESTLSKSSKFNEGLGFFEIITIVLVVLVILLLGFILLMNQKNKNNKNQEPKFPQINPNNLNAQRQNQNNFSFMQKKP